MDVELLVRVECRSEGGGEQRPVAVRIGGSRLEIRRVLRDVLASAPVAGEPSHRRLRVELENGDRLDLLRRIPDGPWRLLRSKDR